MKSFQSWYMDKKLESLGVSYSEWMKSLDVPLVESDLFEIDEATDEPLNPEVKQKQWEEKVSNRYKDISSAIQRVILDAVMDSGKNKTKLTKTVAEGLKKALPGKFRDAFKSQEPWTHPSGQWEPDVFQLMFYSSVPDRFYKIGGKNEAEKIKQSFIDILANGIAEMVEKNYKKNRPEFETSLEYLQKSLAPEIGKIAPIAIEKLRKNFSSLSNKIKAPANKDA